MAAIAQRPSAIIDVTHSHHLSDEVLRVLNGLRERGVATKGVPDVVLERMVESTHHEGVILRMQPSAALGISALSELLRRSPKATVLALDRVQNPHNLGAIVRSAAFFEADAILLESASPYNVLTPSAIRTAEGGAESVLIASAPNLAAAIAQLKKQSIKGNPLRVFGLERAATTDLRKLAVAGPSVWVLGNEREGLSPAVRLQCDQFVSIGGDGPVDSLNVSVAAGILLAFATAGK